MQITDIGKPFKGTADLVLVSEITRLNLQVYWSPIDCDHGIVVDGIVRQVGLDADALARYFCNMLENTPPKMPPWDVLLNADIDLDRAEHAVTQCDWNEDPEEWEACVQKVAECKIQRRNAMSAMTDIRQWK